MFADPTLLRQTSPDTAAFDRQAFQNAARRGAVLPVPASSKDETGRSPLLEYAAFVLDQEARYCQQ